MRHYHDTEWGVPVHDSRMLWETLMLEGFQAGLSWSIILKKREAFRAGFASFDPLKVAAFGVRDVERLMADAGIVRARNKINATIRGAQIYNEMQERGEDFADLCWSYTGGAVIEGLGGDVDPALPAGISKDLKKRGFKFVGPTIVHAWMQAVGIINDHEPECFRRREVGRLRPKNMSMAGSEQRTHPHG
jgi:DNA-3-methyladenine glycosylase I